MSRKLCYLILAALFSCTAFTACGKKELPEDTPYNNGFYAVMETENGYYSNLVNIQCLRFYEKETGTEIFLCGKPECQHDGSESCTATYRRLNTVNSVLYDGFIYILATEEADDIASFNLYRAALDGSSLDKVGEVFSAENHTDKEVYFNAATTTGNPSPFIIHKGCAYIPFFLSFDWSIKAFVNGGIMKMDLQTGRTEQIYAMEMIHSPYPWKLWGCGDYVYFDAHDTTYQNSGTYRYCISDDSVVRLADEIGLEYSLDIWATSEDKLYIWGYGTDWQCGVSAYDSETLEFLGKQFAVDAEGYQGLALYQDKFFIYRKDGLMIYSKEGEKLGELPYDFEGIDYEYVYSHYESECYLKISNDRVYAVLQNSESDEDTAYWVYSCPIEDIINGTGKWSVAYAIKSGYALGVGYNQPSHKQTIIIH